MEKIVVTNNPKIVQLLKFEGELIYLANKPLVEVLIECRNLVHLGYPLLTHPLSGSIKPNETLYKTIILSKEKGKLNFEELQIVEGAIETVSKLERDGRDRNYSEKIKNDFQLIDFDIIYNNLINRK